MEFQYADRALEKALHLHFRECTKKSLERVQNNVQLIADRIGTDVRELVPPERFLVKELTKEQKKILDEALIPVYASKNLSQQASLQTIPIQEEGERMVSLTDLLSDRVQVSFSKKTIHEACASWAGKKRIFYLREQVAMKLLSVSKALNSVELMPHVEDCWRHEEVQEGLLLRRIIAMAREYPDWDWQKVRVASFSFTAASPGLAGHQAGAAIDLRLRSLEKGNKFLPLGNEYPEGSAISSLDFPYLTFDQWTTRVLFAETMRMAGFKLLRTENWHASHGDRGLGIDGAVHMRKAFYGPIKSFTEETGEIQPYAPSNIDYWYVSDREVEDLVEDAREKSIDGYYMASVVDLVARLRKTRPKRQ